MEKKQIASLYLSKYSTLLVVLEQDTNGFNLQYIKKITNILDLNMPSSDSSTDAINEIKEILSQFNINNFFITLNNDYYIATHIPGSFKENSSEFIKLVNLSIQQYYTNKNITDFKIKTLPVNSTYKTEYVTIIDKEIIFAAENIVAMLDYELTDINPTHISAINSYFYNYIENINNTVILVRLLDDALGFILLKEGKILGIEYCNIEDDNVMSKIIENKLWQIVKNYSVNVDSIYFYGDKLNKKEYLECWKTGMIITDDSKRLNPLKLIPTNLEGRDKDYCIRMFHMYVTCIGGALPIQVDMKIC